MKKGDISEPTTLGNYVSVFQLTDIQNEKADSEKLEKLPEEITNYDQSSAQDVILGSPKIENHVSEVYFSKFVSK